MFRQDVYNYGRTCTNCFYSIGSGYYYSQGIEMQSNKKMSNKRKRTISEITQQPQISPFSLAKKRRKLDNSQISTDSISLDNNANRGTNTSQNSNSNSGGSTDSRTDSIQSSNNSLPIVSTPIIKQKTRTKSKKNDGSTLKGTYDKGNRHKLSWSRMSQTQKDNCIAMLRVDGESSRSLEEDGENLLCGLCKFHRVGGKMGTGGVSIYSLASSRKKLKAHNERELHVKAIKLEQKLIDATDPAKLDVFTKKMQKKRKATKQKEMLPLVALAFWIATNNVAIRKFLSLRKDLLPSIIKRMVQTFKETFDKDVVRNMNRLSNKYVHIVGLVLEIVCLASVNCERGFSLMNIIKTFLSNRLRVCLVSDLMTIKSSEWKLDYVVDVLGDEIIGKYNAMKERRCAVQSYTKPSYKEKKRKKNKKCNDKQEAD
eukprot:806007_1